MSLEPSASRQAAAKSNFGLTDEEKTASTKTDSNGRFSFPQVSKFSLLASLVPARPDIPQKINIVHAGRDYLAWLFIKNNYDANGELHGKPIELICELTNESIYDEKTKVNGICRMK